MRKQFQMMFAIAGLLSGLALMPASAQSTDDKMSQDKMSGQKMTHEQMMEKLGKMSNSDKAMMFDKMTEKDKMMAMKMAGHDMGKMSSSEKMDMMGKMSDDDKAAAFDKMPDDKKMSMMQHSSMMKDSKKMDQ